MQIISRALASEPGVCFKMKWNPNEPKREQRVIEADCLIKIIKFVLLSLPRSVAAREMTLNFYRLNLNLFSIYIGTFFKFICDRNCVHCKHICISNIRTKENVTTLNFIFFVTDIARIIYCLGYWLVHEKVKMVASNGDVQIIGNNAKVP